jgi:DNA-directed DNA polymerase III PolC
MNALLWCHSGYSFYRGTAKLEELVTNAAKKGWLAMALTDINGVYGAVWFEQFCEEAGVRPIFGAELIDENGYRAVVLVKTPGGWARLCRITSERHLEKSFRLPEALRENCDGLCVLTGHEKTALELSKIRGLDLYFIVTPDRVHKSARFAGKNNLRSVAANSVYYLEREDRHLHKLLRAMDMKTSLSKVEDFELAADPAWMPSVSEFKSWYRTLPEALYNLSEVTEKCLLSGSLWGGPVLFDFESMAGKNAFNLLCQKVKKGAIKRYGQITPKIRARVRKELALIRDKGFSSYFLIIEDITSRFPITCGRGSAAASVVSYCLFITHVDPVRHNLLFERFLSYGRADPPDIDVDFPWDERDDVLDYVFDRYGPERTAMVSNHLSFKGRAAVRQVARVVGIPEQETSRITKRMRGFWSSLAPVDDLKQDPKFRGEHFDPPWDMIVQTALKLTGLPYGMSVHCGGVVIAEGLKELVPLQESKKGVNVIQFEKDQTEDAGLIKMDLLGNRSLAVIRDGLKAVNKNDGTDLIYSELDPLEDKNVQRLISAGKTMGVFYIESPATRQLQEKAGVGDFEHVVVHSSIIRPAAHRLINAYIKRLRGEDWEPIHPKLTEILSETYGIMVYQEDVMKVAVGLAGFSMEEGDELRKVISKKHKKKRLNELAGKFVQGAKKRGLTDDQIEQTWEMVRSFSGYSFCKPHSASYALVSFKSAWLKRYHPAEFMAAVISNMGGYYSSFAYVSEARRMGIKILMPDINKSEVGFRVEDGALRIGFMQVKGLCEKLVEGIINDREREGPYRGLHDFLERLEPDPEQTRILVKARCFDETDGEDKRSGLLWMINAWSKSGSANQMGLFAPDLTPPEGVGKLSGRLVLFQEAEVLGHLFSRHPLTFFRDQTKNLPVITASRMRKHIDKKAMMIGWCITAKLTVTKEKDIMEFVSFEDETGIYESVFFPAAYDRYCHILRKNTAYLLSGKILDDHGAVSLQVDWLKPLSRKKAVESIDVHKRVAPKDFFEIYRGRGATG